MNRAGLRRTRSCRQPVSTGRQTDVYVLKNSPVKSQGTCGRIPESP